jgi:hypothetical protein
MSNRDIFFIFIKESIVKRIILKTLIGIFFIVTPPTALAQNNGNTASGLSGNLQGGAYILQTNSQLYVENNNRHADDLDRPADMHQALEGLASVYLRYQFEGGTAIYAGNPLEIGKDLALSAGVSQPVSDSTLDVAVTWIPIDEVWKNPYQAFDSRDATDMNAYGLRLKLQEIAGSSWEGIYNIDRIDVDNDEIGDLESDLRRDGWKHELGVKYTLPLRKGLSLRPELSLSYGDIEGRSNSYHGFNIGVLLQQVWSSWVLTGQISGFYNQYHQNHPLFDKTRQESGIAVLAQVVRMNLFGVKPLFASVVAGYVDSDANIDFFDSQTAIGLASVGIYF